VVFGATATARIDRNALAYDQKSSVLARNKVAKPIE
jgi:hypothetical protein